MSDVMSEVDDFVQATIPRQLVAERALHNGDVGPRLAMWSRNDPVTVFGAWLVDSGWDGVRRVFERVASRFSDCTSYDFEIVAAGASGDLAYTVGYEHTSTSVGGEPQSYTLRVTNVYRREHGEWKLAHRHADRLTDPQTSPDPFGG
jgi:ketosteroid isomerase-like protein